MLAKDILKVSSIHWITEQISVGLKQIITLKKTLTESFLDCAVLCEKCKI